MSTSHLFLRTNLPISTKFRAVITICSEVITISLFKVWNIVLQSKNSIRGISQLVSTSHLFLRTKLPISTKFHAVITICSEVITISLLKVWSIALQSKNSTRGISQLVSTSHLFLRTKLPISTKFHAVITICTIRIIRAAASP